MAKKCFLSFYYKPDVWRVSTIKQIGSIEEQPILDANKWEEIKKKGDDEVKKWINNNMKGKECLVVLVGKDTSSRRWVKYEIKKAWQDGLGVLAVYIHNMKDADQKQTTKGSNPFTGLTIDGETITGNAYDPPYTDSKQVYDYISSNIEGWVNTAIKARK